MSILDDDRNPLILPAKEPTQKRVCPKCKGGDFGGRNTQGIVTYTCRNESCKNVWQGGGLGMQPHDSSKPRPHEPDPAVDFYRDPVTKEVREQRKPVSTVPAFRKGALIPDEGEDV